MYLHKFVTSVNHMYSETDPQNWELGDLIINIPFRFGCHPGIIIGKTSYALLVACCTTRRYAEFGEENYVEIPEGEGGINHDSFVNCRQVFDFRFDLLKQKSAFKSGQIDDSTYHEIERTFRKNKFPLT